MPIKHIVTRIKYPLYLLITGSALLLIATSSAHAAPTATTRYVAITGTDSGDCSVTPCRNIQYAVDQSISGDTILVAAGTYFSPTTPPCTFYFTTPVVCVVTKSLTIRGGFTTSNWVTYNPSVNVTTIDGQNAHRGVALYDGNPTPSATFVMEGFTIQNCFADGPSFSGQDSNNFGGGMWALLVQVTLRDVKFMNNTVRGESNPGSGVGGAGAGGGLAINHSSVSGSSSLLQRVTFSGNQSLGGGGSVRGGIAYGAMYVYASVVTVQDSSFINNIATGGTSSGSGHSADLNEAYALGAGLTLSRFSNSPPGTLTLNRIMVTGNRGTGGNAANFGGGTHGGGIFTENGTSLTLSDSYIFGNSITAGNGTTGGSSFGGGISMLNTPATIDRTSFISNTVRGGNATTGNRGSPGGGGVYAYRGVDTSISANLTNVVIADNAAFNGTGGTDKGGGGGGIQIQGVTATLSQVTFARNILGSDLVSGQAILLLAGGTSGTSPGTASVNNNIIANHTTGATGSRAVYLLPSGNTLTFSNGLFAGNTLGNTGGNTIVGANTMVTNTTAGFVSPGSPNYNYHILGTSPAKDQATGSLTPLDIDGQSRPYGSARDYGADEYVAPFIPTHFNYLPIIVR